MRTTALIVGYVLCAIGLVGLAIELHGRRTRDPRADVGGIILSVSILCAGAFIAYSMHAGFRLRWSGAVAIVALVFAASCWGDELKRVRERKPFELVPFLVMAVLPVVLAAALAWHALG